VPGSLDYFLVERYLMYAQRGERLYRGRVAHAPYKLKAAELMSVDDGLIESCGINSRPAAHAVFSPGADTHIFPLCAIQKNSL
jgi:uncharacterized protein YqjF (DUF2071 family)